MPIYRCTVPPTLLTAAQKQEIAGEIMRIHCGWAPGTPRKFVHVIFEELPAGNAYCGGEPSAQSLIVGLIRSGRSQDVRSGIAMDIATLWQRVTGQEPAETLVALHEVRPRDAVEWGQILPESGEEDTWIAERVPELAVAEQAARSS